MNLNSSSLLKTFLAPNKERNQCRNLREIIIAFVYAKTFVVCGKKSQNKSRKSKIALLLNDLTEKLTWKIWIFKKKGLVL